MEVKKKKKSFNFNSFLTKVLRASFKKTPMYHNTLAMAKEEYFVESKTGKPMRRVGFRCAGCKRRFREYLELDKEPDVIQFEKVPKAIAEGRKKKIKMIAVDHVHPIVDPDEGFDGWGKYIQAHFFGECQVLCNYPGKIDDKESCHAVKTREENAVRVQTRKKKKGKGRDAN